MKTVVKYYSDILGVDVLFVDEIKCSAFERDISNLNTYIGFGLKYDDLVEELKKENDDFATKFLEKRGLVFEHFRDKVSAYMLSFVMSHERELRKYLDNKLQYVETTYSSSYDCHDEHEYYAFPAEYTEKEILDYIGDCAQSWYDSMGYGEDENDYVEDEGPDYSYEVHPLEEVMKYGNFTEYTIA